MGCRYLESLHWPFPAALPRVVRPGSRVRRGVGLRLLILPAWVFGECPFDQRVRRGERNLFGHS